MLSVHPLRFLVTLMPAVFAFASQFAVAADSLIDSTDVSKPVAGTWTRSNDELVTRAAAGSRIALPLRPNGEYDFRVSFTRQTYFPRAQRQVGGLGEVFGESVVQKTGLLELRTGRRCVFGELRRGLRGESVTNFASGCVDDRRTVPCTVALQSVPMVNFGVSHAGGSAACDNGSQLNAVPRPKARPKCRLRRLF